MDKSNIKIMKNLEHINFINTVIIHALSVDMLLFYQYILPSNRQIITHIAFSKISFGNSLDVRSEFFREILGRLYPIF